MSKRSAKLKTQKDYKKAMRRLRGKVSFNFDLRKKLTPSQKGRISKALNDIPRNNAARFIKPPRKRGESSKKYAKRLKAIKQNIGQESSPFSGIWIVTGKDAKFSFVGNQILTKWPGGFNIIKEKFIPINPDLLLNDALLDPYIEGIMQQARKKDFNKISLLLGINRGEEFDTDEPETLIDYIRKILYKYESLNFILGFIFIKRGES